VSRRQRQPRRARPSQTFRLVRVHGPRLPGSDRVDALISCSLPSFCIFDFSVLIRTVLLPLCPLCLPNLSSGVRNSLSTSASWPVSYSTRDRYRLESILAPRIGFRCDPGKIAVFAIAAFCQRASLRHVGGTRLLLRRSPGSGLALIVARCCAPSDIFSFVHITSARRSTSRSHRRFAQPERARVSL